MKKIMPFLAIGILVLSGLGAVVTSESENEINETIFFSEPILKEKADFISVNLADVEKNTFGYGEPSLPYVNKVYTFPFGTKIENIEVTFSEEKEIQLENRIEPAPSSHTFSTEFPDIYKEPDYENLYKDIDIYPEEKYGYKLSAGLYGDERVVMLSVTLYPMQYNPSINTIYYTADANIDVKYSHPDSPVMFPDEYDLLIIAPDEFSSALQPLIDHKNNLDPPVRTMLTLLEDIPDYPEGDDEQADIKLYIKEAIETYGITHLILVGAGKENEEIFPVRHAWVPSSGHENYFPCDLYYADIYNATGAFSNWDYDGDGKYAEYSIDCKNLDVHPDVYLGKLPAANAQEVTNVVNKIINYKAHNMMTNKIVLAGADSLPGDGDGTYEGEYANQKAFDTLPGYSSIKLWGTNNQLTKQGIKESFHAAVDFVDFSGHGSHISWATHPPDDEETWIPEKTILSPYTGFLFFEYDLFNFQNGPKLPVVIFTACSNNNYMKTEASMGWVTVSREKGAGIACFAEAGIGHGPAGDDFIHYGIGWMEVHIYEEIYNNKELGESWGNCITGYYHDHEADKSLSLTDYKTMLEFLMFGDPTLRVEDGDDPKCIPLTHNPVQPTFLEKLEVNFPRLARLFELILARFN